MKKEILVIEGVVARDRFGSWSDCSPGVYVGDEKIDSVVDFRFRGKNIRVTIEEISIVEEDGG